MQLLLNVSCTYTVKSRYLLRLPAGDDSFYTVYKINRNHQPLNNHPLYLMSFTAGNHTNWWVAPEYPAGQGTGGKYVDAPSSEAAAVAWCALDKTAATSKTWSRTKTCYVKKPGVTDTTGANWTIHSDTNLTGNLHLIPCPSGTVNFSSRWEGAVPAYSAVEHQIVTYAPTGDNGGPRLTYTTTKPVCDAAIEVAAWAATS